MDSSGVPKKINRYVLKTLMSVFDDGLKFNDLLKAVEKCNKRCKPVPNMKEAVSKSLENYQEIGLVLKDDKNRYKVTTLLHPTNVPISRATKRKHAATECAKQSDWNEAESGESCRKKFRSEKPIHPQRRRKCLSNRRRRYAATSNLPRRRSNYGNTSAAANNFDTDITMSESDESERMDIDENESTTSRFEEVVANNESMEPAPDNNAPEIQNNNEKSEETRTKSSATQI